jgi:hypothetical protein
MVVVLLLFLALLAVAAVYVVRIYNGLVALRENVRKAWSNIDVLLTQRHDELPKLVETCKRYMAYEQETLERVMQARAAVFAAQGKGDVAAVGAAEQQLRDGLGRLFAVAENYPARGSDRRPARALQRGREPEQHPHPDLPGPDRRADVRVQAVFAARIHRGPEARRGHGQAVWLTRRTSGSPSSCWPSPSRAAAGMRSAGCTSRG